MSRMQRLVRCAFSAQLAAVGEAVNGGEKIDHEAAEFLRWLPAATDEQVV